MKAKQIGFQLVRRVYNPKYVDLECSSRTSQRLLKFQMSSQKTISLTDSGLSFCFLNQEVIFKGAIDWNYSDNGKLWTYNLNYFDLLSDDSIPDELKITLMRDFFSKRQSIKDGMEPYPISLRNINWIKFCWGSGIKEFDDFIYSQSVLLSKSFEYHLLGNHLLENAFSLLFAAYYFKNENFYDLASSVLKDQLAEQILSDGGHFEKSPMYHQIILHRLLDSIHLIQQDSWIKDLIDSFEFIAGSMLSWISQVSFSNGQIPMVNDSTAGIVPDTNQLGQYASQLQIQPQKLPLGESGYRMIKVGSYECFVDLGNIGPDYIPGHAHSDTFSFELYQNGQPFIVDTGVSTYENNKIRWDERSTRAHNTVEIANLDQSEVWGAFRVARRARVIKLEEKENYFCGVHDGYSDRLGVQHKREFIFESNLIIITDTLCGATNPMAKAYFHFPLNTIPVLSENKCLVGSATLVFQNGNAQLSPFGRAEGFNIRSEAWVLEIEFAGQLETRILL